MNTEDLHFTIEGAATVTQASDIAASLRSLIAPAKSVVVSCTATQVDVTFLQILLAGRRSAQAAGGDLRLAQAPEGALAEAIEAGGFAPSCNVLWSGSVA
jgi:ABC-type transporter Mla MlaB component